MKIVTGKHKEVLATVLSNEYLNNYGETIEDFLKKSAYQESMGTVLKDLSRQRFLKSGGKGAGDHIHDWVNTPSNTYVQGNMTADVYASMLCKMFIRTNSPRLANHIDFSDVKYNGNQISKKEIEHYIEKEEERIKHENMENYIITSTKKNNEERNEACTKKYITEYIEEKAKRLKEDPAEEQITLYLEYQEERTDIHEHIKNHMQELSQEYNESTKSIGFAYYDDQDEPCGVSISYCEVNPSLWTAAIIRKTTAAPEDRIVQVITSADIMDATGEALNEDNAANTFLNFLNSREVATLFTGIISDNGHIALDKASELQAYIEENAVVSDNNEMLVAKRELFDYLTQKHGEKKAAQIRMIRYQHEKNPANLDDELFKQLVSDPTEKKKAEIVKIRSDRNDKRKETLDKALTQSVVGRNLGSMSTTVVSTLALVSLVLIFTGVFAPFGLVLATTLAGYLVVAGMITTGIALVASVATTIGNERHLSAYGEDFQKLDKACAEHIERTEQAIARYHESYYQAYFKKYFGKEFEEHFEKDCRPVMAIDGADESKDYLPELKLRDAIIEAVTDALCELPFNAMARSADVLFDKELRGLDETSIKQNFEFLKGVKLDDLSFENIENPDLFLLKNNTTGLSIEVSNRPQTQGELRGHTLREFLESAKNIDPGQTAYNVIAKNLSADVMTMLKNALTGDLFKQQYGTAMSAKHFDLFSSQLLVEINQKIEKGIIDPALDPKTINRTPAIQTEIWQGIDVEDIYASTQQEANISEEEPIMDKPQDNFNNSMEKSTINSPGSTQHRSSRSSETFFYCAPQTDKSQDTETVIDPDFLISP